MKGKAQKGVAPAKATGGKFYAGGDSNVAAEAKQSTGGFKRGGKTVGKPMGMAAMARADRKPRKSGGGVFSSAASGSPRPGFKG